ncbi:hypothetical protein CFP56_036040 [Quercus suber]|uniref:Uncharacterized protein n=1 Tax=Quercus suber TaxID=58331 RepID=A0AAW0J7T5_QUESU
MNVKGKAQRRMKQLLVLSFWASYYYKMEVGLGQVRAAKLLPFLERTTFFLYPIGAVIVLSPILILSGFNPSRYLMNMYFSQRL